MTSRQALDGLANLPPGMTPQTRGREFERWLNGLLSREDMQPRTSSFRPAGEEIDGSFFYEGRFYLLEAKWWKERVPASAIYQFKGKVDGKLIGTIGVFISMSGYAADAVDALRVGKDLNVLLFDREDVSAAAEVGFSRVLRYKLRMAAERGEVFVPYATTTLPATSKPLTVVIKSLRDEMMIRGITKRLSRDGLPVRNLEFIPSLGVIGLANVAMAAIEEQARHVIIFADFAGDPANLPDDLTYIQGRTEAVLVGPWSTDWLGLSSEVDAKKLPPNELLSRASNLNFEDLRERDGRFERLIRVVTA
ncbi:restriction endonuclease [Streptomyces leeuwenhoekii]|uniref:restriction endonuclease n=1 Tax=Streptomyces leeuwenhoekii TaxID=1437453 RepID=UPI000AAB5391|nr:restriction endonuclease [Streptomyces leeuwenhoekii]